MPGTTGMNPPHHIIVFSLEGGHYALDAAIVERVVPALEITPLPQAPAIVLGVFSLQGRVIPVVDVRQRFGLPERPIFPEDRFIVARAGSRTVALAADAIVTVAPLRPGDLVAPEAIVGRIPHLEGVVRMSDGLVLLHDLERFLALDEAVALGAALARQRAEVFA